MTVEPCTHNHNHTLASSNPPKPASRTIFGPNTLPSLPRAEDTNSTTPEDEALVGVFDRITLRLESFENTQRTAVDQVRQELVAAIGELASTKRARVTTEVEASRRDLYGYGFTHALYAPFRAPYSPSDYSNLPPLIDHEGKVTSDPRPFAPSSSHRTLATLQAESDAAYLRLASKVNGEEWQVVDDPTSSSSSTDYDESTPLDATEQQVLSPPTLPTTPIIVSPSSSTAQSCNIIVNLPTLPLVSAASIASDTSDVSSDCSSEASDVSASSGENDQEEEEEVEGLSASSSDGSDSDSDGEEEEEDSDDEEHKVDYNPTIAKLEISLLRAKLKLAKLQYLRYVEKNTTIVAVEDKEEVKVEHDDLWSWEERKAMVEKLVVSRSKGTFEKEKVKVYVAEVVDEVLVVDDHKPYSYLESIE